MFAKVLVANRGKIAVRIICALRELNLDSVAVFSDAGRDALRVRVADGAVCMGPAVSHEGCLAQDKRR
jgi:acetyl-CoA carboxylase biotin carboxylase subunit